MAARVQTPIHPAGPGEICSNPATLFDFYTVLPSHQASTCSLLPLSFLGQFVSASLGRFDFPTARPISSRLFHSRDLGSIHKKCSKHGSSPISNTMQKTNHEL